MRTRRARSWPGFPILYGAALGLACLWILLDAFVIPRGERLMSTQTQTPSSPQGQASAEGLSPALVTETSYKDGQVEITLETKRAYDTTYYVAKVRLQDASFLRTAFAENTYGRNIRQTTSQIAEDVGALLAVNGDYYGFRNGGYVLRNGQLFRQEANDSDLLLIDRQGDFTLAQAAAFSQAELNSGQWWQVFSFGPILVHNGATAVSAGTEVRQSMNSNPRTAIGQLGPLSYVFVVSDGRTEESQGLSLWQLAEVMKELGCQQAYNLDGGGSSTMVFMGRVVNKPTSNGRTIKEREVSDIVYIGL